MSDEGKKKKCYFVYLEASATVEVWAENETQAKEIAESRIDGSSVYKDSEVQRLMDGAYEQKMEAWRYRDGDFVWSSPEIVGVSTSEEYDEEDT